MRQDRPDIEHTDALRAAVLILAAAVAMASMMPKAPQPTTLPTIGQTVAPEPTAPIL